MSLNTTSVSESSLEHLRKRWRANGNNNKEDLWGPLAGRPRSPVACLPACRTRGHTPPSPPWWGLTQRHSRHRGAGGPPGRCGRTPHRRSGPPPHPVWLGRSALGSAGGRAGLPWRWGHTVVGLIRVCRPPGRGTGPGGSKGTGAYASAVCSRALTERGRRLPRKTRWRRGKAPEQSELGLPGADTWGACPHTAQDPTRHTHEQRKAAPKQRVLSSRGLSH